MVNGNQRRAGRRIGRGRARERGAALFLVVLVMTLLMGIGAFAARSAHLATASSGYVRQQTQARYLGEYGLQLTAALMSGSAGQGYMKLLGKTIDVTTTDVCQGQTSMKMPSCLKLSSTDLTTQLSGESSVNLCDAVGTEPGSLGMADAECFFGIELTDKMQGMTPAGFDLGAGKTLKFFYATATTTAQVRIKKTNPSSTTALDPDVGASSGTQTLRSRILAGPYPAN